MVQTSENASLHLISLLKDYSAYNVWANRTLTNWLRSKSVELLDREIPSSFPSLKQTLVHIRDTQQWWLDILLQVDVTYFGDKTFTGNSLDIYDELVNQSELFADYVEEIPAGELQTWCSFNIPTVGEFNRPRFEMIQHCMNHSTYHRGQLITIARNLGLTDPPMTDFMVYLLMGR